MKCKNLLLLLLLAGMIIIPLVWHPGGEFSGTDNQASDLVTVLQPDYTPWFDSFWVPPSQVEGLLFAVQAALGAGFIGYYLGYSRGRRRGYPSKD